MSRCVSRSILCLIVFLSACESRSQSAAVQSPAPGAAAIPYSREADDVGRFIAGMPGKAGSPFLELQTQPAWVEHRQRLDRLWKSAQNPLMSGIADFAKQELSEKALRTATVFYPFSGPDALTLVLAFPDSPSYVMVGLEPAGTLPALADLEKKDLPNFLAGMRSAVGSELTRSFFITRQMDREFRGQVTDGLMLPILHLLVRTGNTILGVRYVRLDEQGRVIERAANYKAPGKIGNKGIELEFRSDADRAVHRLIYFSVNLSDERLKQDQPFMLYAGRLNGTTTLLKATSYMTHHADFSLIREQILNHSAAILQDDSGIPYRFFNASSWNVVLYGDYQRPYGSFRWLEQSDLRKAYASGSAKPLSLHLGYGYSRITSNLLLARRKEMVAHAPAR